MGGLEMNKKLIAGVLFIGALTSQAIAGKDKDNTIAALPPSTEATGKFVDSTAAQLAPTKRVAITEVTIIFQTSAAGTKKSHWLLGAEAPDVANASSLIEFSAANPVMVSAISGLVHVQLEDDLRAAGFEIVPEAEVLASPTYKEMLTSAGVTNPSRYANKLGDAWYAGSTKLGGLYMPYAMEVGTFQNQPRSFLGWMKGGKILKGADSATAGGPNATKIANNWKLPMLEVKLAKELGAHVVKATYVVTLGSTGGATVNKVSSDTEEWSAPTQISLGLLQDQTRIAFRLANGKNFHIRNMLKQVPAMDGDVVVTLANPLLAPGDYFNFTSSVDEKPIESKIDKWQVAHVTLKNEAKYVGAVVALAKKTDTALLGLVRQ